MLIFHDVGILFVCMFFDSMTVFFSMLNVHVACFCFHGELCELLDFPKFKRFWNMFSSCMTHAIGCKIWKA